MIRSIIKVFAFVQLLYTLHRNHSTRIFFIVWIKIVKLLMRFSTTRKSYNLIFWWWCYDVSNVVFLFFFSMNFVKHFTTTKFRVFIFTRFHFFRITFFCFYFATWFHSIVQFSFSMNIIIVMSSMLRIAFVNNNLRCKWIFMKLSFCFFILQIQRKQCLNDFLTMSSILLTMMSRRKNNENVF